MGRRGRSSSPMSTAPRRTMTTAPAHRAPPPSPPAVAPQPQASPMPFGQQQRGPGLMGQIAATAVGVGIGSAVGHTVGHAITGGFGGSDKAAVEAQPQEQQQMYPGQPQQQGFYQANHANSDPCGLEMKQFLECAQQNSNDISLCSGFNEVLKACRVRGSPQQQYM